jgi:gliding motility-associated-like protein
MIANAWVNPGSTISSYLWNDVSKSSTNSITLNASGTYMVTVTDSKGCSTTVSKLFETNLISTVSAASSTPTLCSQTALTNITHSTTGATGIGTAVGLPSGVTAAWSSNLITLSGTPTESGLFNYTIPLTGGCENINATGTITVSPISSVSAASSTPTLCVKTALTNITHSSTGATGIGRAVGLPAGVTATWSSNLITLSGTPTESGLFNYTIPLTGGCVMVNATGTITVSSTSSVSAASSSPTLCIQTALTNITHTTTGVSGIGRSVGLPAGVTATWSSDLITLAGTPTESGLFNYSIPLTGGCDDIKAMGTITVTPANTVSVASATPTLIINSIMPAITHTTTGATGIITVTGLPSGVLPSWSSNIITIRGTPTESGIFNYRIALTGGCGNLNATGTITVLTDNKVDDLLCDQLVIDNKEIYKDEPYDGVIILSYKGGNGTNFTGFTLSSTGVSGLNLSLKPGKLAFGSGSIELIARGVSTDTGKAMFNIDFGTKSCVLELPVKVLLPKLSSIDCDNSQLTPDDLGKDVDYAGVLKINYQGGNNGKVIPVTLSSTGVSGLTLTGDSLRLNPLGGTIKFSITGKPTTTGVAGFNITIGDKTCKALFNVIDNEVKLSSFFTPNGDGKNDRWEIPALVFYPEAKVYIFDRSGRLLVEYSGASPGWDGMIGNYPASSGDYWYVIHVTKDDIRKGNFTLIK